MTKQEIKKYTRDTILSGNGEKIKKVLQRYWQLDNLQDNLYETAKSIFKNDK